MTAPQQLPEARPAASTVSVQGLVDALDRLIGNGVAVAGDVIIGVAGIDLIRLDLRALLLGVQDPPEPDGDRP